MEYGQKIAMISPYPELSQLSKQISLKENLRMSVYTAVLEDGVKIAKDLQKKNFEAIISRGPTGALIKAAVNIPVIFVEITAFDLMETLHQARQISEQIAFFDYIVHKGKYDFVKIREMLGLQSLRVYYYRSQEELDGQIENARLDGCGIVVASGICIVNMAQDKGIQGIMINSSGGAVREALARAQDVIAIRKHDLQITERLKTIINHAYGGIIAVDTSGCVTHYNTTAKDVLQITSHEIIGQSLRRLSGQSELKKLFADGAEVHEDIQRIGGREYLVSRVPLALESENFGMVITFQEVSRIQCLEAEIRKKLYADGLWAKYDFSDIIGNSPTIKKVVDKARKFAKTEATVLITGESGTGKELFAQSVHNNSLRAKGPFMAVNCAAIPETLLESELFGYEKGAYTGANKDGNPGLFEISHGGTLFLDEILGLTLPLQARLLRALQEKAVRRVGGHKVIPVDVRIIAAANRNIRLAVKEGTFREDLFYRLNVLTLNIPPLRERSQDIPLMIEYFLKKYIGSEDGSACNLSRAEMQKLISHAWPGNVRELEHFVKKFVILTADEADRSFVTDELFGELFNHSAEADQASADMIMIPVGTMKEMEETIIHTLSKRYPLDKGQLARKIGVSRTTLWKKLKEHV